MNRDVHAFGTCANRQAAPDVPLVSGDTYFRILRYRKES
jgi:hypothetical protein